ncbi:MAG: hypothetical protein JO053_08130 [Acidobacteria bacterium]|nr:hypothetical protein [Acidobacteriota bacterium]
MSKKTIANIFASCLLCIGSAACGFTGPGTDVTGPASPYAPPVIVGNIRSNELTESSGLAASRCQSDLIWTHNDSGDGPYLFAMDLKANVLAVYKVPNAQNHDWEDIAEAKDKAGKCYIFIGDIGDNENKRSEHQIYRVPEPIVTRTDAPSDRKHPIDTENPAIINFSYPDQNQDGETLMVNPLTGNIYVVTKHLSGPAGVYRFKPEFDTGEIINPEKVGELSVPSIPNGFLTGGDISPDATRMIICDYTEGYEYVLPAGSRDFDEIWKQQPAIIDLGKRPAGESVTYSIDGTSIFAGSEHKNAPLIEIRRKQ